MISDFPSFFRALWGYDPFPWQSMLAEHLAASRWPQALDLPTAAGKTACIDVALYALAMQAERPLAERTAPRRIWFVVDRRIVVDEAHARAQAIADKLLSAKSGPLSEVAERLLAISGLRERPLAVARLRGGVLRDDGWARAPSQPAIITSTVDQLGSRLLFRGYGQSALTASLYAGLAANDSLIILDEAHCSVPFMQTLRAIENYRGPRWAQEPLPSPFAFAILSATPPMGIAEHGVFPGARRDEALDHDVLRERMHAAKHAALVEVPSKRSSAADVLVERASESVCTFLDAQLSRIGVIVNRVQTAESIRDRLQAQVKERADVVLLTGRMRPFERDQLVQRWKPFLRAASPDAPPRPIVLVATQCLEVGADFSFDALVSEAASLDALRQRFGRLDRMGKAKRSQAVLLIRERDANPNKAEADPIYGMALANTWKLLRERAENDSIDFGIAALQSTLSAVEELSPYLAPSADAPVLLPAHLDMLCQTAPRPKPEPDVSLFLHGKEPSAPQVQVLWRADLDPEDPEDWLETVAQCPPVTGEMLSTPLHRLRKFLSDSRSPRDSESDSSLASDADIEGLPAADDEHGAEARPCLVWRGRDRSRVARSSVDIQPDEVVVLPAAYGMQGLGQAAPEQALGRAQLDLWEPAQREAGRLAAVRLTPAVLHVWSECPPVAALVDLVLGEVSREALDDAVEAVLTYQPADAAAPPGPPAWWRALLAQARPGAKDRKRGRIEHHSAGGLVLFAPASIERFRYAEPDLFADDDDLTSASGASVSLDEHSELVQRTVEKIAARCVPAAYERVLKVAAYWHDVGKLDERFQVLLRQGDELAVQSAQAPLAKSEFIPASPERRRFIREASGLPRDFRHEMLSLQLAERHAPTPEDAAARDLLLHLVASHHGHARPFAPVSLDPEPPPVRGRLGETAVTLSAAERAALPAPHRVDSGIADRFWQLCRRHGWWGLSYLEAILRLGDWYASGRKLADNTDAAESNP